MSLQSAGRIKEVPRRNRIPDKPTQVPFTPEQRAMLRKPMRFYDPSFAEAIIEKMSDGYSLGGFAGQIGVARRTINKWMELHPEFEEACSRAMAVRQLWFEDRFLEVCKTGGSQAQPIMFGLMNAGREDWKQKQEIEHTGQITLASLVESSLRTIDAQAIDITPQSDDAPSSEPDLFG